MRRLRGPGATADPRPASGTPGSDGVVVGHPRQQVRGDREAVEVLGPQWRLGLGCEGVVRALPRALGVRRPRLDEGHVTSIVRRPVPRFPQVARPGPAAGPRQPRPCNPCAASSSTRCRSGRRRGAPGLPRCRRGGKRAPERADLLGPVGLAATGCDVRVDHRPLPDDRHPRGTARVRARLAVSGAAGGRLDHDDQQYELERSVPTQTKKTLEFS